MNNDFPVMLYKAGGPHEIHGGCFDTLIAHDEIAKDAAYAAGWRLTTTEAAAPRIDPAPDDDAPATRAELETKAAELGIAFDGRTSDAKLAARIADKLKG